LLKKALSGSAKDYFFIILAIAKSRKPTPSPPKIPAGMLLKMNPAANPRKSPAGTKSPAASLLQVYFLVGIQCHLLIFHSFDI
jgi:hypothetical protein